MTANARRVAVAAGVSVALLASSTPVSAHDLPSSASGLPFGVVVAGVVVVSLLGGAFVLRASGWLSWGPGRVALPVVVFALGVVAVALAVAQAAAATVVGLLVGVGVVTVAREAALTDCGPCADAALGAVTLHRGLEGVVLATIYAADAALGLVGAVIIACHAAAETAAVGSLYASAGYRYALAAVFVIQVGFLVGIGVGWGVAGGVSATTEAGLLALVGGVLLVVGTREARRRHVGRVVFPSAS